MRRYTVIPVQEDPGPLWTGGTPEEQGYKLLDLPNLHRPDKRKDEYRVYSTDTEYKTVEAESALAAVTASEVASPVKVSHMYVRIDDVMDSKSLQYIGMGSDGKTINNTGNKEESKTTESPEAEKAENKAEEAPAPGDDVAQA